MPGHHRRTRRSPRVREMPLDQPAESPPRTPQIATDAIQHLENLRVVLGTADPSLYVRLVRTPTDLPRLHVNNRAGGGRFAEDISVREAQCPDDHGYYVWSWGEEITPVMTPEIAAERVRFVLAVRCRDVSPGGSGDTRS